MTFQKINFDRHYSCRLDFNTSSIILKASATKFSTRVRIRIFDQCLSGLLVQQRYFRRQGTRVPSATNLVTSPRLPLSGSTQYSCRGVSNHSMYIQYLLNLVQDTAVVRHNNIGLCTRVRVILASTTPCTWIIRIMHPAMQHVYTRVQILQDSCNLVLGFRVFENSFF